MLRTIGYTGLNDIQSVSHKSPESLMDRPDQLAQTVSWIEDRKVSNSYHADSVCGAEMPHDRCLLLVE